MKVLPSLLFCLLASSLQAQTISITVNATQGHKPVSPWIYGKNNSVSNNATKPTTAATWQKYKDVGLRLYRENGGNNATKYNWRKKISSHPDWYNNVYSADWDHSADALLKNTSNTQGFYAFQLLGKVASNTSNNFNDWAYNQSAYWSGVTNNWAGGGNPGNGNPDLYMQNWPADSTSAILDHWFAKLKLDSTRLRYWNMDNEPEIWSGTHDDIATSAITAEDFIQKYIAVAKAVRSRFPGIKLVGPVSPNEWQFYTWNNTKVKDAKDGKMYTWMEYFIKRISEEQKASGIRLLDVLDVHFYPSTQTNPDLTLQLHRFWFDTQWNYPGANGVKTIAASGWDESITKEYFFERCNQWLVKYMGLSHKVTFGISEYGTIANSGSEDPNVIACWYASHLGTFADKGVELFTPWEWYKGQWEVLHMFSNYYGTTATQSVSDNEPVVGSYASLSDKGDTLTVVLVNKDRVNSRNVEVSLQNINPAGTAVSGYQLSNLPTTETFVSKSNNALEKKQYTIASNKISLSVPKLSVTLIQIPALQPVGIRAQQRTEDVLVFPNPVNNKLFVQADVAGCKAMIEDMLGRTMGIYELDSNGQIDVSALSRGSYVLHLTFNDRRITKKIIKE